MMKRRDAAVISAIAFLALPGAIAAQTPRYAQYGSGPLVDTHDRSEKPETTQRSGAPGTATSDSDALPFTGLQAGFLALGGAAMITTGAALRRGRRS